MDRDFRAGSAQEVGTSPASAARAFADALLGKCTPSPLAAQAKAQAEREHLAWLAQVSSRHAEEQRRLRATEAAARHSREQLKWAAQISTEANDKLRALQQTEARQRDAGHVLERFRQADSVVTEWSETDHPRAPKGTSTGGQWVAKGGGTSAGSGQPASNKEPDDERQGGPSPHMLQLAHMWWKTKGALDQARRDIKELPHKIRRERAALGSGGRYAFIHPKNLAKAQRDLAITKALAPELQKQLDDLEQEYRDSGYDEVYYSAFTAGETVVGGKGIDRVGAAVAMRDTPAGLQSTGTELEIASTILGGPAVLRLGKALLGKAARRKAASKAVTLKPYGGAGGGHHIPAKRAFEGAARYDAKTALAIPNDELARLNVRHAAVTGAQKSLYREFSKTGAKLTWDQVERIETAALVRGGLNSDVARATVKRAIDALKKADVPSPTRIPWGNQ